MGFSSDPQLFLYYADSGIRRWDEKNSEDRLSWNLETRSTGGWRAGKYTELGGAEDILKVVYYRM